MTDRLPPLRRIHEGVYEAGTAKSSLEYHRRLSTELIVASLAPEAPQPLIVKADGTIVQGNTRIKVLEERGFPVDESPRIMHR
ncbi:MAG: hypothetical protein JO255_17270 [Alphaproteobacteria bacterium]|nr:hypothetical protein [Alphaproteobacteria bacterium]